MKSNKLLSVILITFIFLFSTSCAKDGGTVITDDNPINYQDSEVKNQAFNQDDDKNLTCNDENEDGSLDLHNESEICVCITGAVLNPGVYYLEESSRVYELINAAGGLLDDADIANLNLVSPLSDGMQISIRAKDTERNSGECSVNITNDMISSDDSSVLLNSSIITSEASSNKVNINTADETLLTTLPSIGKTRALAIIEYRNKNGNFSSIEDITKVSGIKEGTFEKLKDLICVR